MENLQISAPEILKNPLYIPNKILMGPGPSNASHRVLNALSQPILGHMHAETFKIMDEIKAGIRYAFQTHNEATMCVSASGHAGMEMALSNLIEKGTIVLLGTTGHWGLRATDIAERNGAIVHQVESNLGQPLTVNEIKLALDKFKPHIFFIVQGESSTGLLQLNLKEIGQLCRLHDCLFIVDTVASLGGTPFFMDAWFIDVVYTGSQKVLGAPPGITPISFNERAMNRIQGRKTKPGIYNFDALLLAQYWGCYGWSRIYHHTISSTLLYGLREALALLCEEGLVNTIKRHELCAKRLQAGLSKLGLEMFIENEAYRLPTVNAVKIPNTLDWKCISEYAMKNYRLEISGGLGPTVNKILRIGVMGVNATEEKIDFILKVLEEALKKARVEGNISKI